LLIRDKLSDDFLAYLVLVDNPEHHCEGDFQFDQESGKVYSRDTAYQLLTFSGLSVVSPRLISNYPNRRRCFPLLEALQWAIDRKQVVGEYYPGYWQDVGTPQRLQLLRSRLADHDG
jgi:MurNAc alpha-1-phosphate uridylyltransferase